MKTLWLALALSTLTAGLVIAYPTPNSPALPPPLPPATSVPAAPLIEAVFVLDTTGSMSGLIQAAKENIWSIASSMASAQPTPELRIGLVAFRDRGDDYVTRRIDLSTDLDSMYARLMDFQAGGGGDGPESVNQALFEAVHKMGWSQREHAYRVIFLVGDAPPHMDYQDDVPYPQTLKAAAARGIVVNTIQAGADPSTAQVWQEIAALNQGAFFNVAQSGSAIAVATPYDDRLAALSRELDDTRLFFGDEKAQEAAASRVKAAEKLHAASSPAAQAKRAAFNASAPGRSNLLGENELVDAVSSGRVELDALPATALPEPLRELDRDQQRQLLTAKAEQRARLEAEIAAVAKQRDDHIAEQLKDTEGKEDSLDYRVYGAVKAQAEGKGLRYAEGPKH